MTSWHRGAGGDILGQKHAFFLPNIAKNWNFITNSRDPSMGRNFAGSHPNLSYKKRKKKINMVYLVKGEGSAGIIRILTAFTKSTGVRIDRQIELTRLPHYDSLQTYSIYENDCMISHERSLYLHAGVSGVRLNDGPDNKLFILFGWGRSFFVCCLAHRSSTVDFLLLQCYSGVL